MSNCFIDLDDVDDVYLQDGASLCSVINSVMQPDGWRFPGLDATETVIALVAAFAPWVETNRRYRMACNRIRYDEYCGWKGLETLPPGEGVREAVLPAGAGGSQTVVLCEDEDGPQWAVHRVFRHGQVEAFAWSRAERQLS